MERFMSLHGFWPNEWLEEELVAFFCGLRNCKILHGLFYNKKKPIFHIIYSTCKIMYYAKRPLKLCALRGPLKWRFFLFNSYYT